MYIRYEMNRCEFAEYPSIRRPLVLRILVLLAFVVHPRALPCFSGLVITTLVLRFSLASPERRHRQIHLFQLSATSLCVVRYAMNGISTWLYSNSVDTIKVLQIFSESRRTSPLAVRRKSKADCIVFNSEMTTYQMEESSATGKSEQ